MPFALYLTLNASLIICDAVLSLAISHTFGADAFSARAFTTSLFIFVLFLLHRRREKTRIGLLEFAISAMTLTLNSALFTMIMLRNPILQPITVALVAGSMSLFFGMVGYERARRKIRNRQ